eukprot:6035994-Prymnesium_polylepis.1
MPAFRHTVRNERTVRNTRRASSHPADKAHNSNDETEQPAREPKGNGQRVAARSAPSLGRIKVVIPCHTELTPAEQPHRQDIKAVRWVRETRVDTKKYVFTREHAAAPRACVAAIRRAGTVAGSIATGIGASAARGPIACPFTSPDVHCRIRLSPKATGERQRGRGSIVLAANTLRLIALCALVVAARLAGCRVGTRGTELRGTQPREASGGSRSARLGLRRAGATPVTERAHQPLGLVVKPTFVAPSSGAQWHRRDRTCSTVLPARTIVAAGPATRLLVGSTWTIGARLAVHLGRIGPVGTRRLRAASCCTRLPRRTIDALIAPLETLALADGAGRAVDLCCCTWFAVRPGSAQYGLCACRRAVKTCTRVGIRDL